jgi:hypothetical protein
MTGRAGSEGGAKGIGCRLLRAFSAGLALVVPLVLLLGLSRGPVGGSLLELADGAGGRFARFEASGIAYFRGNLVVVDDTLNSLFVFDRAGRLSYGIDSDCFPHPRAKFEGVAVDAPRGRVFIAGSHTGWDQESLEDSSLLLRVHLEERAGKLAVDESSVVRCPIWRSFERLGLWKPGGMSAEGLAYDPARDHLYLGLREPHDRARIYRVRARQLADPSGEPPPLEELVSFDAGRAGDTPFSISALLWLPARDALLILTSTEDDTTHEFLGNRLWCFSETHGVTLVKDTFDRGRKAEGLALGDGQLFIGYDNDQDDTGLPSQLRVVPWELVSRSLPQS